jgi:hypothetical protein
MANSDFVRNITIYSGQVRYKWEWLSFMKLFHFANKIIESFNAVRRING